MGRGTSTLRWKHVSPMEEKAGLGFKHMVAITTYVARPTSQEANENTD